METSKVPGAIIAAAAVPLAYALAFFYGFAFRLSFFSEVGIPLQWLSLTYFANAGAGSPLLFQVVQVILYAAVWFFLVKFPVKFLLGLVIRLYPDCFGEKARTITESLPLLFGLVAFFVEAYRFNHAPCGKFICWMVFFGAFVVGAALWFAGAALWRLEGEISAEMKVLFFTTIVLLYFGWYGIDQAVYFGKKTARNNTRTILTVDSQEYVYYETFGEFFIVCKMTESQYSLVPFPSKDAPIGKYTFQTKELVFVPKPPCSSFSWLRN